MKDLVIIVGTIILGCFIFYMIAGDKNSLKSSSEAVMKQTIQVYEDM